MYRFQLLTFFLVLYDSKDELLIGDQILNVFYVHNTGIVLYIFLFAAFLYIHAYFVTSIFVYFCSCATFEFPVKFTVKNVLLHLPWELIGFLW